MDFLNIANMRYSCRNFDPDRPVEREKLEKIIEAGRLSPSACNGQPYHFTVCEGEDYLKVVSLQLMYVHLEHLINESQLYSSYEKEQIKITKLISTIRRQSIYNNLYQYSDSTHKCYGPETMEYTDFILYSSKCTNTIKLDGVLDLFQDLVLGYYAPEIVLINDITDILTFQMNPIEFSSFAADIYGLQNLSLALSIANEILDFSDNPLQEGDYCVRVSAGRVGYFYYSDSGQLKHIRIVPLSEATLPGL